MIAGPAAGTAATDGGLGVAAAADDDLSAAITAGTPADEPVEPLCRLEFGNESRYGGGGGPPLSCSACRSCCRRRCSHIASPLVLALVHPLTPPPLLKALLGTLAPPGAVSFDADELSGRVSSAVDVVSMSAGFSSGFSAAGGTAFGSASACASAPVPASEAVGSRGDDTDDDDDRTCRMSLPPPLLFFRPKPTPTMRLLPPPPPPPPPPLMGPLPLMELLLLLRLVRALRIFSLALRVAPGAKDELLAAGLRPAKIPSPPAAASSMLMESPRPCPSLPRRLLSWLALLLLLLLVVVVVVVVVLLSSRTLRFSSARVFLNDGRAAGSWAQHALVRAARSRGASSGTAGRSPALTASTSLSTPATPFHGILRARISHNTTPKLYTSLLKLETCLLRIWKWDEREGDGTSVC